MLCTHCGEPRSNDATPCPQCGAPQHVPGAPGGFWARLLATLMDLVFCTVLSMFANIPLSLLASALLGDSASAATHQQVGSVLGYGSLLVIGWLYSALWESSRWQATPGKKILGLVVSGPHGEQLGLGLATRRFAAKALSALLLGAGFLPIALSRNKAGLHDRLTHTRVSLS